MTLRPARPMPFPESHFDVSSSSPSEAVTSTHPGDVRRRLDVIGGILKDMPSAVEGDILAWRDAESGELRFSECSENETRIGRSRDNSVVLSTKAISRHHAVITAEEGGFVITDLGSTNGTRVNGASITSGRLGDGVLIELGGFPLVFSQHVKIPLRH
ncbi:MAG: hypothetical protein SynsKO_05830 [Synoicihabitans sp.]